MRHDQDPIEGFAKELLFGVCITCVAIGLAILVFSIFYSLTH
jgi:hypothetical protein